MIKVMEPITEVKKVMKSLYVHKSNLKELFDNIDDGTVIERIQKIIKNFDKPFEIVKYDSITGNISLIDSPDWDTVNEPTVGDSYTYKPDGSVSYRKGGTQVYHNKWQFVAPDYTGFDIEKAKQRTKEWNAIPDIRDHKSRIGYKNYWHDYLRKNGLEI